MEFNFHLNYGQKNRKNKSRADLRECSFCFYSLSTLSQVLNVLFLYCEQSVAYDRSSAPKDCRVSGWLQGRDLDLSIDANKMFLLAEFTYDLEKSSAQTFDVLDAAGTKWNFLKYKPGLVGGHCIGVDPYYLAHKAEALGYHPEVDRKSVV